MLRRLLVLLLCLAPLASAAQPRIGVLGFAHVSDEVKRSFTAALREEGLVEGKDIRIEWRSAQGSTERAKAHAEELVRLQVAVIVAMLTPAVQAASDATRTIPIVMATSGTPERFVKNFARPEGNVTGVAGFGAELSGKRIEILQELFPGIRRIGLLVNTADPFSRPFVAETQTAAKRAGIQVHLADARRADQVDAAFSSLKRHGVEAVIVQGVLAGRDWQAAQIALRHGLPALSFVRPWAESGGLVYHASSATDTSRRAASFVRRLLDGAKPGDLPAERPTRTELVLNLRTAKALRIEIPKSLLLRADQLIE